MKNLISFLVLIFLFINQNLICRESPKSLFICDSISNPITNAYIEIKHSFWGSTVFHGKTNEKGLIEIQIPDGKYEIIISHLKYNQYYDHIVVNNKNNLFKYSLSNCYDYCILEGQIKFNFIPPINPFICGWFKKISINLFDASYYDYELDSTGYYQIKLPKGKYKINFMYFVRNCDLITKEIDFIENKKIISDVNFYLTRTSRYYNTYLSNYENIFEGLQYFPGINLTK